MSFAIREISVSKESHHEVVKLLLALIKASFIGYDKVVKLFITERYINANSINRSSHTVLVCASEEGHYEVIKLLKAHGAIY